MAGSGQHGRTHIVVVNSSVAFLTLMREILQEAGYVVTTTNFVLHTFAQINGLQPDLLIVDVAVGQTAGWELLEALHADAAAAQLPVLVVSTDPNLLARAEAHAERYGHHQYLEKPFQIDQLLRAVEDMIGPP
jgi:CheY-like chemotaxis protein